MIYLPVDTGSPRSRGKERQEIPRVMYSGVQEPRVESRLSQVVKCMAKDSGALPQGNRWTERSLMEHYSYGWDPQILMVFESRPK